MDDLLHERQYQQNEVVFDAGEDGQAIYFVFAGKVTICRQGQPESGRIAELGPGSFFGELALLDNSPRAAQAGRQLARHLGARLCDSVHGARAEQHL